VNKLFQVLGTYRVLNVQGERIGDLVVVVVVVVWLLLVGGRAHLIGRGISLRKGDELRAS
jgi:hypothetical protein